MQPSVKKCCRICGVELTAENCRVKRRVCRKCENKRSAEYYQRNIDRLRAYNKARSTARYWSNPEKFKADMQNYRRKHVVCHSSGTLIRGVKRDFPVDGLCELCRKKKRILDYHHYDDADLRKGLWLCKSCHIFAELIDKGFLQKYLALKEQVMHLETL